MNGARWIGIGIWVVAATQSVAQAGTAMKPVQHKPEAKAESSKKAEQQGIEVRVKDIARFRGIRGNQLMGYGLVVGLDGTGDTKKTPFTSTLLANALKKFGTMIDPAQLNVKNVAAVSIVAELPPFSAPGNRIDVTVQSIGDAKSLQGGTLLQAPLYGALDDNKAIAVAMGPISIGGFQASSGGSSVQKNQANVGRIPGGAFVETSVPYQMVFEGNKLYLELDDADLTTAQRIAAKLGEKLPNFVPTAVDGGTIEISLPTGTSPVMAMSQIESTTIYADIPAVVVVNERTGTIVLGGNVKIGPAVVAQGNLKVEIQRDPVISQPNPLSGGNTVAVPRDTVTAEEETAQIGLIAPNATVGDLAKVFQAIKASPSDIISILQALKDQGALKARIKVQ